MAASTGVGRLWIKDETRQPTASLKDRASAMALTKAAEFGAARLAIAEVTSGLDAADALRAAAATYVAGFSTFDKGLGSLAKIRSWVKREGRKAEALAGRAEEANAALEKAIGKLAKGTQRS